ncbi:hypothetical protein TYRP_018069 [Tyrophagus putrescentiae]|nr:hypothetical protein TYRP_007054 [Tyrophagus putrescentiae]KAH9399162.1 hypothetical protein TYRP_018069 [Tyrophagus putrescentiae]
MTPWTPSLFLVPRMAPTPALRAEDHHHHHHHHPSSPEHQCLCCEAQGRLRTDDDQDGLRGWMATKTDGNEDRRQPGWMAARMDDNEDGRPGWTTTKTED